MRVALIDIIGIAILVNGFFIKDLPGTVLMVLGAAIFVGATIPRFREAAIISPVLFGLLGYLIEGNFIGGIIGACVGLIVGGGLSFFLVRWSREMRKKIDQTLDSARANMDRNRNSAMTKLQNLDDILKASGAYVSKSSAYRKELKYIKDRMKSIRYNSNNPRSMESTVSTYLEINGDLDRLRNDLGHLNGLSLNDVDPKSKKGHKGPYVPSEMRTLDADKYSETFGKRDKADEDKKGLPDMYGAGEGGRDTPDGERVKIKTSRKYSKSLMRPSGRPVEKSKRKVLPNYEITTHIGSGEFSDVFFAKNDDGQEIVVKMPRLPKSKKKDLATLAAFMTNVKLWDNLDHDNIVKMYESEVSPAPHIAMERMEGGDLDGLMKTHNLDVEEAVHIMLQILKAVSHAHEKSTIHKGLKPKNILFTRDGVPKIGDWGWDKFLSSSNPLEYSKKRCRLAYCAPEQVDKANFGKIDEATDIFQLGIIFYEMLTGRNPFYDMNADVIQRKITTSDPSPPSNVNPQVTPELDLITMRALYKKKSNRWTSVEAMYKSLCELVDISS